MKQQLEELGWKMYYECQSCGFKQFFSHAEKVGYEVRIRPRQNTFSILKDNMVIAGPFWGYELKAKLLTNGL